VTGAGGCRLDGRPAPAPAPALRLRLPIVAAAKGRAAVGEIVVPVAPVVLTALAAFAALSRMVDPARTGTSVPPAPRPKLPLPGDAWYM